jgi:hypothetical protein
MNSIREMNAKFLAFHRMNVDIPVQFNLLQMTEVVSPEQYLDDGTSSTKIRKENNGN